MIAVAGIGGATETEAGAGLGGIIGLLVFLAYIIWALVLFARGTTPGKKVLGMRVIKEDGTPAGFMTMLLREWDRKMDLRSDFVARLLVDLVRQRQSGMARQANEHIRDSLSNRSCNPFLTPEKPLPRVYERP